MAIAMVIADLQGTNIILDEKCVLYSPAYVCLDAQGFYSIHKCLEDLQYMFLFSARTTKALGLRVCVKGHQNNPQTSRIILPPPLPSSKFSRSAKAI